ncbi:unnamed protein product [Euphydryas editha]|uniref:Uncharacterized protein n=1 Tax=Euphydryas editha TaxID=104508 RepID=A0AAU9USC1_EUPED|nr:unnamed protein product [Euphydryas editha]
MACIENMSLNDIIKQNQTNRISCGHGRGGRSARSRGGDRGGYKRCSNLDGRTDRCRQRSRAGSSNRQSRSRSRSRVSRDRSHSRGHSHSRLRSKSQQRRNSYPRTRSASRCRFNLRSLTPKGMARLENDIFNVPGTMYSNSGNKSMKHKPLAIIKRGISKTSSGLSTRNWYSSVGLEPNQILQEQRKNCVNRNIVRPQTFTRTPPRNNVNNSISQLTISIDNDFAKGHRNNGGNVGILNKQMQAQLNNDIGGYNTRRGPGSIKFTRSNMSSRSDSSRNFNLSRGRGFGRGVNRGIGRKCVNRPNLNSKLQKEIAAIQSKSFGVSYEICINNNSES